MVGGRGGGSDAAITHRSPQDRRDHAQKCLVEQALLDLPPRHDAVPFPNISAVKMCAAAKPGAPHSMAPACEVARRAQRLLDRYWANSEEIRRLNTQALHDGGVTAEKLRSMAVNLDWSRKNPREYPYSQHRKAYDEIAQGVGCSVKCNVAQAGRTPPAGWAHVTQRHKTNIGVKVAKVLDSMEDNWMGVSAEATLLSSYQLIVSFTDRSDTYSSYYPRRFDWNRHFRDVGQPAPSKEEFSALFVSTFCTAGDSDRPLDPMASDSVEHVHGYVRATWIKQLMAKVPIKSFGGCWHTPGASCPRGKTSGCTKVGESSKYPFHIAMENFWGPGYATEKFFEALQLPSIPIVMTATDVGHLYAPTKEAYINAADFGSPDELAVFLKELLLDDERRARYSAWKQNATLVEEWRQRMLQDTIGGGPETACGICEAYVYGLVPAPPPARATTTTTSLLSPPTLCVSPLPCPLLALTPRIMPRFFPSRASHRYVRKWGCHLLQPVPDDCPGYDFIHLSARDGSLR